MAPKNISRSLSLISVAIRFRSIAHSWILLPMRGPVSPSSWDDEACDYFVQWIKYSGNYIIPITGLSFKKECPSALLLDDIGLPWKRLVRPAGLLHKKRGPFQHQVCVWRLSGLQCSLGIGWLSLSDLRMLCIFKGYLHFTFGNCVQNLKSSHYKL